MPVFLSDPTPTTYLLGILFVVIAVSVWYRFRDRRSRILLLVAMLILGGLSLSDWLVESPREESIRRIEEIQAAINAHQWKQALPHFAEAFQYQGRPKASLSDPSRVTRINRDVSSVATWDFARDQVEFIGETKLVLGFMARGSTNFGEFLAYFRVTFEKQADGSWKITTFDAYIDPLRRDTDPPIRIPGW